MNTKIRLIAGVLLTLLFLAGCQTGDDDDVIRVGSKDFTENLLVGEIYALALEDAGFEVERKLNIGGSIVHTAITSDEIDLYPEYTGTGLLTILKMPAMTDADAVYQTVKEEYEKQFDLLWLTPSDANDSQGIVLRTDVARNLGIVTISDLQKNASEIRFASQGEFEQRDDGIPGLEKAYGPFDFKSIRQYDNGLKYQILESNEADAAPAYTTEGQLVETEKFTVLEDDKHVWPPYFLAPVVRKDTLEQHPEIEAVLDRVNERLDMETMIRLNSQVDVEKREFEEVANEFFESMK